MKPSRTRRRVLRAAGLAVLGGAAWEVQRRRDVAAVAGDPHWTELNEPLDGRGQEVPAADGTRLHAEVFGPEDAPTIVLAHGWVEALQLWHYQIRDLARDYRVVAYDQRGHGRSALPESASSYTAEALAGDLQSVVEACVPPAAPFVVAGHSMGGMTIVAWAARHPEQVRRRLAAAVLVNTGMNEMLEHLLVLGPRGAHLHAAVLPRALLTPRRFSTRFEPFSYRIVRRIALSPTTSPGRVAFSHRMFVACPAPVRAGFGRLFQTLDLTASVPALTAPALVIAGELDRLLPPWHSQHLRDTLPDVAGYVELTGIAHMAPLEAPEVVTAGIHEVAAAHLLAGRAVPARSLPLNVG